MKINYYAEHDTDKIIREKYFPDLDYKGVIVEVGAATPGFISTTKHFKENGWRAIHIEPNPEFVKLHLEAGNEIYQYACGDKDENDIDFTVVSVSKKVDNEHVSDHSYSSFYVKQEYKNLDVNFFESLSKKIIKVHCRKLDTIINEIGIKNIDILSIDTEGWEIEVMGGLSSISPKLVILENLLHLNSYTEYMQEKGYKLTHKQIHNYFYEKIN
jgi:FkbM family methyltransferase